MKAITTNKLRELIEAMLEGDLAVARARCDYLAAALRRATELPERTEVAALLAQMLAVELMSHLPDWK